ncbi:unnamed protein product, partial [Meganyctiphanes norvegica]
CRPFNACAAVRQYLPHVNIVQSHYTLVSHNTVTMSDKYLAEYDEYNMDDNLCHGRSGGKHRTKSESEQHKHHDKEGHTRKIVNNMQNNKVNNVVKDSTSLKH